MAERAEQRAYAVRSVNDPDLVVSFGLFAGRLEELRAGQRASGCADRRAAVGELIESTDTDELFEVTKRRSSTRRSPRGWGVGRYGRIIAD